MNLNELTKVIELLSSISDETKESSCPEGLSIVILQRGWVVIGDLSWKGKYGHLKNASVIRNWGTTNGLGEIALNGPTETTKLDKCGVFKFHELTSVGIIDCNKDNWS